VWWFTVALPYLLGNNIMQLIACMLMDECGQEWDAVRTAISLGLFSSLMKIISCSFHKLYQALEDPRHLGRANVMPRVFDLIYKGLEDINHYEYEADAIVAFQSLQAFVDAQLDIPHARYRILPFVTA